MATTTYSPEYLAESKVTVLNTFYAIPIFLELASTSWRIWSKTRTKTGNRLGFEDCLMIWATVCLYLFVYILFGSQL
jgi:hypothetical protein